MTSNDGPLSGLRVVDFTWAAMGPYAGYLLAGLGAEVIQVSRPLKGSSSTTASITQFFDVGKIAVQIDVKLVEGKQTLLDLIEKSDIFLENFRPGVVESLGLDFESLSKINPNLIMVSGSALGRGGSDSSYVGYAPIFSALSGLADSTGFEDGRPTEIRYPADITSGAVMAFAAIAGAADRQESGTYVDLAARDALLWTLTSSFIVNSANKPMKRLGNSHDTSFPHGVFKCAGHDQWVSISVGDETKRQAIYSLIGRTDISELALMSESDKQSVEHSLESWASQFEAKRVVIQLQSMGVAAFASVDSKDIWEDKHLRAREVFRYVEDIGWVAAPPWRRVGQQEQLPTTCKSASARKRVFNEILGIELDVIEEMLVRGVIG
tara:strand:- start:1057 stop:2196 length:1140 start_codon:yes stop_codon:yes gene_type:complete